MTKYIKLKNVQTNNLKGINVKIPRNKLTVITGLSGSGKTSLAFNSIYAQARKEYLESVSVFNRRERGKIEEPKIDSVTGLSPAIAIEQKRLGNNPRSTIGTFTDIYTYLRLLFSRFSKPIKPELNTTHFSYNTPKGMCRKCKGLGWINEIDIDKLIDFTKSLNQGAIKASEYQPESYVLEKVKSTQRFDFDKPLKEYTSKELDLLLYAPPKKFPRTRDDGLKDWTCEGIITRIERLRKRRNKKDLSQGKFETYQNQYTIQKVCPKCNGGRLNQEVLSKTINNKNIAQVSNMSLDKLLNWLQKIEQPYPQELISTIINRIKRLNNLGLNYLNLNRPISTLSGGESQRIKLAKHLGLSLIEMIYILDEPTIGMHPINVNKIIQVMKKLRDKGNTIIVVEHDLEVIKKADFIIDLGPGAGKQGGQIIAQGNVKEIKESNTHTGKALKNKLKSENNSKNRSISKFYTLENVTYHNLKNISVKIAKDSINLIVGASGAGKSSLIEEFVEHYPQSVMIDQSPIGRSSRSNPATYTGLFDLIRSSFAEKANCSKSLLSFNSKGKCPKCKGKGVIEIGMHFMEDIKLICKECNGTRFNSKSLKYKYNGYNIANILNSSVNQAYKICKKDKAIKEKLQLLKQVGLGYIKLGQDSTTLSGGEAQRIKLAKHISSNDQLLILDEPTIGLHTKDSDKLLTLLHQIADRKNTIIIIEHNAKIINNADWLIELGPQGGESGGELLYQGSLNEIQTSNRSIIKSFL